MGKVLKKIEESIAGGESACCAECGAFHGWHHPDCSKVTVEELRILLQSARSREQRNTAAWKRQREKLAFWQAKHSALRHENNKLRRRLKRQFVKDAAVLDGDEIAALIAGLQDVQAGRVREYRARAESNGKENGTNDR